MSSSLKEAVKALNQRFSQQNLATPLPEDLERILGQFVVSHPNIDESESQKLHDDLMALHNKYVVGNPEKHAPFVATLRTLRPVLRGESRLDEWWTLIIKPTVDAVGHRRDTIEDAKEFVLGVMEFDPDEERTSEKAMISEHFTEKLIDAYLERTRIPSGDDVVSPEDEFIAHELEGILVAFGRKKPKELLMALDDILVIRERRLQALSLLSSFVRLQPPNLQSVLETNMIKHLHSCLLMDNSSTVVDLALTILIMFIPHITSTLIQDLPKLFLIYARILCWDQYQKDSGYRTGGELSESEFGSEPETKAILEFDPQWDIMEPPVDGDQGAPKPNYFFTFLYGLFPLNFMAFIRRPRRYLKMKGYGKTEDLELYQDLIKSRTESHRVTHKLHPNFFITTPEDELTDNKWLKSEPADLVSKCLGLCIAVAFSLNDPGPPPTAKLPALPKKIRKKPSKPIIPLGDEDPLPLLSTSPVEYRPRSSHRNTQSTTLTACSTNYPETKTPARQGSHVSLGEANSPPTRNVSPHRRNTDDILESPIEENDHKKLSSAPPSPPLSTVGLAGPKQLQSFAQVLSRFPTPNPVQPGGELYNTAALQSEIMLLKNDLNFERFQKMKYMEQISHFQRRQAIDVTVENDAQSLMNKNRILVSKLAKADEKYEQLKKETATSRSQSKKFEEQLSSKLKILREEERGLRSEVMTLTNNLEIAQQQCEDLKKIVVESENRESESKNKLDTLEMDLEDMVSLRGQIYELSTRLHEFELRDIEFERTREEHGILRNELETSRLKLASSDAELDRMRRQYEQRIYALESNAKSAQQAAVGNIPSSLQQMIDSALASSHSKVLQLKKTNAMLQHKCLDLELRCQELEGNGPRPGSVLSLTKYADDMSISTGSPPASARESIIGPSPISVQVPRVKSVRRPAHDFAPSASPLIEEDYAPTLSSTSLPTATSTPTMGNATLPLFATAPTTATHSLNPSPSATAPPSRYGPHSATDNEISVIPSDPPMTHDFQIGPSVTDSLASTLRVSGASSGLEASLKATQHNRVYGRGGAGNMIKKSKEDPDKKKAPKSSGFRLKGIM